MACCCNWHQGWEWQSWLEERTPWRRFCQGGPQVWALGGSTVRWCAQTPESVHRASRLATHPCFSLLVIGVIHMMCRYSSYKHYKRYRNIEQQLKITQRNTSIWFFFPMFTFLFKTAIKWCFIFRSDLSVSAFCIMSGPAPGLFPQESFSWPVSHLAALGPSWFFIWLKMLWGAFRCDLTLNK